MFLEEHIVQFKQQLKFDRRDFSRSLVMSGLGGADLLGLCSS